MLIVVLPDDAAVGRQAADMVAGVIARKPDAVLGLATGASPLPLYNELARRHEGEGLDFARVRTVNLDDYLGLPPGHPASCRCFMDRVLFGRINLQPENILIPDGGAEGDLMARCAAYEQAIAAWGGIDLQVLGIGRNGHLGFNEPGSGLDSRTRIVRLSPTTRTANRATFSGEPVPEAAITIGLGTIRSARRLLLLATGANKAEAIAAALEGPITASLPASLLQLHEDAVVLLDPTAAAGLTRLEDYAGEVDLLRRLTPQRLG